MLPATFHDWLKAAAQRSLRFAFAAGRAKTGPAHGMGMTEKQGGSDVLSNTTHAESGWRMIHIGWWDINGFSLCRKSDAHSVLAQAKGVTSCFFVPFRQTGNGFPVRLERLKDKLGNRSNASAEVEFQMPSAGGWGEEGEGIRHI